MSTVNHLSYLLCTSQGVPLVTKVLKSDGRTVASSSYWKTICQYICLAFGLWKETKTPSITNSFSFSLQNHSFFVVYRIWEDQTLLSCVEGCPQSISLQPYFLAYYLLHHFCRLTTRHNTPTGKTMLTQLLQDIADMSQQLAEGTFADTIGVDQDEAWENFLVDHQVRDDIQEFEEYMSKQDLISYNSSSHLSWMIKELSISVVEQIKDARIFIVTNMGTPLVGLSISAIGAVNYPLESFYRDELHEKIKDLHHYVSNNEMTIVGFHDKMGIIQPWNKNDLAIIVTNLQKIAFTSSCVVEDVHNMSSEQFLLAVQNSHLGKWLKGIHATFELVFN